MAEICELGGKLSNEEEEEEEAESALLLRPWLAVVVKILLASVAAELEVDIWLLGVVVVFGVCIDSCKVVRMIWSTLEASVECKLGGVGSGVVVVVGVAGAS